MIFLFISLIFTFLGFKFFKFFNLLDKPKLYGFKRKPVPYSFGLVLFLIFLVSSFFYGVDILNMQFLYISAFLITLMAFFDDNFKLNPILRLLIQIALAVFVVKNGVIITEITNPLNFNIVGLGALSFFISVFWIVFLTNVINFLDGVEGLSSGVSSVAFFTIGVLSLVPNVHLIDQSNLILMTFLMSGVSFLAFLFEFPKPNPNFLVGDSGTMFYGFLLACFSMISGGKLFTLLIVLLIPVIDAIFVIFYRILNKKLPFIGDKNHFHHKLLELNFSRSRITASYFLVSVLLGMIAIFSWNTYLKFLSFLTILLVFSYLIFSVWKRKKI